MGDPLYTGGIGVAVVLITLLKVLIAFAFTLVATMFMVWFERKIVADMQHRIGPNRAGPWGLLQTLADGTKLFFKEDLLPDKADRRIFRLAPILAVVPAFLAFSVIPLGGNFDTGDGTVSIFGHRTFLQLADPPVGVLFFLAMSAIGVYGIMLAGWSSGSKYPLLGGVRATAQIVSYEAALGLSVVAVLLVSRSVSTHGIVGAQSDRFLIDWNLVVTGVVPAVVFLIAGTAELNRPPFDLVEAEQELVGGFNTEYSSIRFAMFFLAEFMNTVTMSALIVTMFLGGPSGPTFGPDVLRAWILPLFWFFLKLVIFLFVFVWFRGTLPRLRYDQLMDLGWKALIPISLGWLLLLATIRVAQSEGWPPPVAMAIAVAVLIAGAGLLSLSLRAARRNREADAKAYA
ncbi:MAG: NADH-quinone oxidoreductase subunit NuoH [Acidimicrobiales bacterium]